MDPYFHRLFAGKKGIEIGGPSPVFREELPVYDILGSLDGCNYSPNTVWSDNNGEYVYAPNKSGKMFIAEASNMSGLADASYEVVISAHCLEHCANPLKVLKEWARVLRLGGVLLTIVPIRKHTFDHRRPITTFAHLLQDYYEDKDESDLSHLEEILALHDLSRDPPAGTLAEFRLRSLDNMANRCLHHHVFDIQLAEQAYEFLGIQIHFTASFSNHHLIIGTKR